MPTFMVTDPTSGRKVRLTGDSPPTDAELEEIFAGLPSLDQIAQQTQPEADQGLFRSPSEALEQAKGVGGAAGQLASTVATDVAGGLAGLGTAALTGIGNLASDITGQTVDPLKAGAETVERVQSLGFQAGDAGQQFMQESVQGALEAGQAILGGKDAIPMQAGKLVASIPQRTAEAGFPGAATVLRTIPEAAAEIIPGGLVARGARQIKTPSPDTISPARIEDVNQVDVSPVSVDQLPVETQRGGTVLPRGVTVEDFRQGVRGVKETVFNPQTVNKKEVAAKIQAGSNDIDTATFELVPNQTRRQGPPRVQVDKEATEAVKQGFSRGSIADFKVSNPETKGKFGEMVNIAEKIKNNERFGMRNRPSDVLGDSLMDRLRLVQNANKRSGVRVGAEAKNLKGKPVNIDQAANNFLDSLDEIGISINEPPRNAAGDITGPQTLNFKGSDIEGATGAENAINKIFNRMSNPKAFDGAEAHRLKNFIDEQVTFGKNAEGLAGVAEKKLKDLRFEIKETLNATFPKYGEANKVYSETIDTLDAFQDVAGRKMDLTGPNADKATGTLMRRLMGNAQSRITLLDSIDQIEDVAKRHGGFTGQTLIGKGKKIGFVDDLENQVLMANQLDKVFGIAPGTSLQGIFDASLAKTAARSAVTGSPVEVVLDIAGKVISKTRGVNEEAGFKAIRALIKKEIKKKS